MFGKMFSQERLEQMGRQLERAMDDINIIIQHPERIKNVVYETSEDKSDRIFDNKPTGNFIRLLIEYEDSDGVIKSEKRKGLANAEKELMAQLELLKKEQSKYD
jgi:hypothetical protein